MDQTPLYLVLPVLHWPFEIEIVDILVILQVKKIWISSVQDFEFFFKIFIHDLCLLNNFSYLDFLFQIVSYIILRNVPGWIRTRYSSFFAWFGKISLEVGMKTWSVIE